MPKAARSQPGRGPKHGYITNRTHLAGYIAWLPPRNTPDIDLSLEEGCYYHPVVVLSPLVSNGKVIILILTSFGETDLWVKLRKREDREGYLPIAPANAHPDNNILLWLSDTSLSLRKKSYINTKKQCLISFTSLRKYSSRGKEYVLSKQSYQKLIDYAKFIPPPGDLHQATLMSMFGTSAHGRSSAGFGSRDAVAKYLPTINHPNKSQMQSTDLTSMSSRTHIQRVEIMHPSGTHRGLLVDRSSNALLERSQQHMSQPEGISAARLGQLRTSSHNYGTMNYSITARSSDENNTSSSSSALWEMLPSRTSCLKILQLFLWFTIAFVVGYYVYRGGCWTIWAVGVAVDRIKNTFNTAAIAVTTAAKTTREGIYVPIKAVEKGYSVVVESTKDSFIAAEAWIRRGFLMQAAACT